MLRKYKDIKLSQKDLLVHLVRDSIEHLKEFQKKKQITVSLTEDSTIELFTEQVC